METEQLINLGNQCREENNPEGALAYYAQALTQDRNSASAFNNYGNVLRECGDPAGAIPFLQRSIQLNSDNPTSHFNLAVAYLLNGDYRHGWKQYETRWQYEHLAGTLPKFTQPRWIGQNIKNKTVLIIGEQGHGDNIQFVRFVGDVVAQGARAILVINDNLKPLFASNEVAHSIISAGDILPEFDYWIPIMSIPDVVGNTLENLGHSHLYLKADPEKIKYWQEKLGFKKRLRVGFCWSGRRDTWINRHKGMPFEIMLELIKSNTEYEWINLQCDCTTTEEEKLINAGVTAYPGSIKSFADSAALIHHLDVVLSVDTAVAHLACALGRPTWIMLNQYALDWRWLLDRDDSPWYPSARLFRQPKMGDWANVTNKISQYLSWFKV